MGKRLYAYSIKTTRVRETDFPYNGQKITCTSELLDFARLRPLASASLQASLL